jgi:transcriptional regulator of acetoin/glycerol metabolism
MTLALADGFERVATLGGDDLIYAVSPPIMMRPPEVVDPFNGLDLGDSRMAVLIQRLRRAAHSDIPILLHGETGTGKELFARAIHEASPRRKGRFVAVNCASIPEGLIESELFGYRPGAFTGASSRGAKGLIQQADGGTLFLDEIGDMPLAMQSRLLRVLAEREVTPIGAEIPIRVNFRVVSATHRDLAQRASQGLFREDLLFRLQGLAVTLPSLRQRTDIVALCTRVLESEYESLGRTVGLSAGAAELVRRLPWPGNVRQLKQVLCTAAWLTDGPTVTAADLELILHSCAPGGMSGDMPMQPASVMESIAEPGPESESCAFGESCAGEREDLLLILKRNRWNVSRTATELKSARTTIYRRMARLGIVQPHLAD